MCFYLKSTYWAVPESCDVSSLSVSAAAYLGPVASRGVLEIWADEFPWHGFHIMHKSVLKICRVGHIKAPLLPFPSLKVPLAHQVIFSFWLENCWALLKGPGSSLGVFHWRNLHPVIGELFDFPLQSERSLGMQCLSVLNFLAHICLWTASA